MYTIDDLASFLSRATPKDLAEYLNQFDNNYFIKCLLSDLHGAIDDVINYLDLTNKDLSSESAMKKAIYDILKYNKTAFEKHSFNMIYDKNKEYLTALEKYNKLLKEEKGNDK